MGLEVPSSNLGAPTNETLGNVTARDVSLWRDHGPNGRSPSRLPFEVARSEYEKSMLSGKWQRVRYAALKDARRKCECCGRPATQVHHVTYMRLGAERPEDTQALCGPCHAEVHGLDQPQVVSSHTETRDGKEFTVNVLAPGSQPRATWERLTTHRRRKRNVRK
jgi:hypothetical protein